MLNTWKLALVGAVVVAIAAPAIDHLIVQPIQAREAYAACLDSRQLVSDDDHHWHYDRHCRAELEAVRSTGAYR